MKRSNAPIFWALFGAGGMLSALLGPVLVAITGLLVPLGLGLSPDTLSYPRLLAFAQGWFGKLFIVALIVTFSWHAAHRIFHSLRDVGLPDGPKARLACYGAALAATVLCLWCLAVIG